MANEEKNVETVETEKVEAETVEETVTDATEEVVEETVEEEADAETVEEDTDDFEEEDEHKSNWFKNILKKIAVVAEKVLSVLTAPFAILGIAAAALLSLPYLAVKALFNIKKIKDFIAHVKAIKAMGETFTCCEA